MDRFRGPGPGEPIRRGDLRNFADGLNNLYGDSSSLLGQETDDGFGPPTIRNTGQRRINIRITGGTNPYSFEEVLLKSDNDTWIVFGGLVGKVDFYSAIERDGVPYVPTGTRVEALVDDENQRVIFSYQAVANSKIISGVTTRAVPTSSFGSSPIGTSWTYSFVGGDGQTYGLRPDYLPFLVQNADLTHHEIWGIDTGSAVDGQFRVRVDGGTWTSWIQWNADAATIQATISFSGPAVTVNIPGTLLYPIEVVFSDHLHHTFEIDSDTYGQITGVAYELNDRKVSAQGSLFLRVGGDDTDVPIVKVVKLTTGNGVVHTSWAVYGLNVQDGSTKLVMDDVKTDWIRAATTAIATAISASGVTVTATGGTLASSSVGSPITVTASDFADHTLIWKRYDDTTNFLNSGYYYVFSDVRELAFVQFVFSGNETIDAGTGGSEVIVWNHTSLGIAQYANRREAHTTRSHKPPKQMGLMINPDPVLTSWGDDASEPPAMNRSASPNIKPGVWYPAILAFPHSDFVDSDGNGFTGDFWIVAADVDTIPAPPKFSPSSLMPGQSPYGYVLATTPNPGSNPGPIRWWPTLVPLPPDNSGNWTLQCIGGVFTWVGSSLGSAAEGIFVFGTSTVTIRAGVIVSVA